MLIVSRSINAILFILLACVSAVWARANQDQRLDHEFQAAVAQYDAGKFAEAATELEDLVRRVPENFEIHELLGMAYSAQSQDATANTHFEKAVRLNPTSAPARTNLATNLVRLGKLDRAGENPRVPMTQ